MPTTYFSTYIWLPPGAPPVQRVREFFRLAFAEFHWFRPVHYGRAALNERLDPDRIDYDALVAFYEEFKNVTVTARTDRDYFMLYPASTESSPHLGHLIWQTSATETKKPTWRAGHLRQVSALMQLFGSPLAQAGLDEDFESKTRRLAPRADGLGSSREFTVRGYGEGLAGLVWRNVFGPPFVRMFGERLATLPSDVRRELGGGLVLVQPYELPTQAGTPEAAARERELIAHLGPECFYDHERHTPPTRRPHLPLPGEGGDVPRRTSRSEAGGKGGESG